VPRKNNRLRAKMSRAVEDERAGLSSHIGPHQ
jgi:hypothetical protein